MEIGKTVNKEMASEMGHKLWLKQIDIYNRNHSREENT